MRTFFVLSDDPSATDRQWVEDQDLGDADLRPLWRGQRLDPGALAGVRLLVNEYPPTDLLPNPVGLTIASSRLAATLTDLVGEGEIQVLNAPVVAAQTGQSVSGYHIVNPLRVVPALSPACAAGPKVVDQLEIASSRVGSDVGVFRPAERPALLVVSGHVLAGLTNKGLQGLIAIPVRVVP